MNRVKQRLAAIRSPVLRGAVTGMLAGIAAAILYALFSPLIVVLSTLGTDTQLGAQEAVVGSMVLPFVAAPFIAILGVFPAMLLGLLGGALAGGFVALGRGTVSPRLGLLLGLVAGIIVLGLTNAGIISFMGPDAGATPFAYWFWLGVPSLLGLVVAAWTGRFVASTQR